VNAVRRSALCVAALVLVGGATAASATRHPLVEVAIDECVVVAEAEVRRVVAIELGALLTKEGGGEDGERTRVDVGCAPQGALIELRVDDPITGKRLTRTIDLQRAATNVRARLLALGIAELVAASWTELESNPRPAVAPVGPPPSPAAREAALVAVSRRGGGPIGRMRLVLLGNVQLSWSGPLGLGGSQLRLGRHEPHHLSWELHVAYLRGEARVSLGAVSIDQLLFGSSLGFHQRWERLALRLAAGLRGGTVQLTGRPHDRELQGSAFWAPWAAVFTQVGVTVALARWLLLELDVEAGVALLPVGGLVTGQREAALEGGSIGVAIGLGAFL
jgi:hypothetical protein